MGILCYIFCCDCFLSCTTCVGFHSNPENREIQPEFVANPSTLALRCNLQAVQNTTRKIIQEVPCNKKSDAQNVNPSTFAQNYVQTSRQITRQSASDIATHKLPDVCPPHWPDKDNHTFNVELSHSTQNVSQCNTDTTHTEMILMWHGMVGWQTYKGLHQNTKSSYQLIHQCPKSLNVPALEPTCP